MNLPEQKHWACMFWEWFVKRGPLANQCEELRREKGRFIAECPHMQYYHGTRDEGTSGYFEARGCPAFYAMTGVTPERCLEVYRWCKDYCPEWDQYMDYFTDSLMEIGEGECRPRR